MKEGLAGVGGGGCLFLGIRGGGMSPVSPNPDPISHKTIGIFHTLFPTWFNAEMKSSFLDLSLKAQPKRLLKIHFEFSILLFPSD